MGPRFVWGLGPVATKDFSVVRNSDHTFLNDLTSWELEPECELLMLMWSLGPLEISAYICFKILGFGVQVIALQGVRAKGFIGLGVLKFFRDAERFCPAWGVPTSFLYHI